MRKALLVVLILAAAGLYATSAEASAPRCAMARQWYEGGQAGGEQFVELTIAPIGNNGFEASANMKLTGWRIQQLELVWLEAAGAYAEKYSAAGHQHFYSLEIDGLSSPTSAVVVDELRNGLIPAVHRHDPATFQYLEALVCEGSVAASTTTTTDSPPTTTVLQPITLASSSTVSLDMAPTPTQAVAAVPRFTG